MAVSREYATVAVELIRKYFFSRTDYVAILAPWKRPQPAIPEGSIEALIAAHVLGESAPKAKVSFHTRRGKNFAAGRFRIGSYIPSPSGDTPWLCIDFDGGDGHADSLEDPLAAVIESINRCEGLSVPYYLEQSGSGTGWHLWVFLPTGTTAADARQLGFKLAPTGFHCKNGRAADPKSNRGIEVFPKQSRAGKKGFGNMVWLPFWSGATAGGNILYRIENGIPIPWEPDKLIRVEPEVLRGALALIRSTSGTGAQVHKIDWKNWRKDALEALSLEQIYGQWLTGNQSGDHWLECRDPDSPSGDRSPSAGVALGTGEAERGAFHSFRTHETVSVFDFLVRQGLVTDFESAVMHVAQASGIRLNASTITRTAQAGQRPKIQANKRQLIHIVEDAWKAIHAANSPPKVFVRSSRLVGLKSEGVRTVVEGLGESAIYGLLTRVADWVRVTEDAVTDTSPVKDVARDIIAYPSPKLPSLDAVVTTPLFSRKRELISAPGYDKESRIYLQPDPGMRTVDIPLTPTISQVAQARELILDELIPDFPFVALSDRAHAVAAILLPFVRRMILGPTPLHLIEAPTPGTGKSLLAQAIGKVFAGNGLQPMSFSRDDEENRKRITAALSNSKQVMLIDNVRKGLESANLAQALTSVHYQDRILGQSKMVDLPNNALWIATANNPRLSLEIARRSVRIRLDSRTDRPWEGRAFRHEMLLSWVDQNRPALVKAVLVLVRHWKACGCPKGSRSLGSFESWSEVVGGILATADIQGFLENQNDFYELADQDGQEWRSFVAVWAEIHRDQAVPAGTLVTLAQDHDMLGSVLGDKSPRSQSIRLGKALLSNRDRQFGSWRIVCNRSSNKKQQLWRLVPGAGYEPS